jgi:hypothetical protein
MNERGGHSATVPLKVRFRRRELLATSTLAALAPFVPILDVEAQGAPRLPSRLVLLFSPNGTLYENWAPVGSETDFALSPILAPLLPYQDKLVVLDGLRVIRNGLGDGHQMGMGGLWTGSRLLPGPFGGFNGGSAGFAGGTSVDQAIANAIGAETPYKSLELGVLTGPNANVWTRMCYAAPGQPLAPEDNPAAIFDRLFARGKGEQVRAERKSVLDLVSSDLASLRAQYGGSDRLKLEAHLEAVRALEQRNSRSLPTCNVGPDEAELEYLKNDDFPAISARQIDQLVMALACDLTRVASLQWSASSSLLRFTWLGQSSAHHNISHLGDDDPSMIEQMTAVQTWYAEQVKYLLDQLAQVPEGDGTLLDHTLVVWGNELSRGNSHGNHPVPFVLAGGANGMIPTGRYLTYDDVEHNRLLVSLCHYMGLDGQVSFGDNDPSSGGLVGLV